VVITRENADGAVPRAEEEGDIVIEAEMQEDEATFFSKK